MNRSSPPVHLETTDSGPAITRIELVTRGRVPGISEQDFQRLAEEPGIAHT